MGEVQENEMDKITTEMAKYICDKLCIYPHTKQEDELEEICCECEMGKFVCDICNKYNKINSFENSQIKKLLIQKSGSGRKSGNAGKQTFRKSRVKRPDTT